MDILIAKLGATGDVVRTTSLLRRFSGNVTWITAAKNIPLLEGVQEIGATLRTIDWEQRSILKGASFDLVVNLEDDTETSSLLASLRTTRVFGAYSNADGRMVYSEDSSKWFDLSLISVHGR